MDLAAFARWAIKTGPWEGQDLYGGDVQSKAVDCGILVRTTYDPAKHGPNSVDAVAGDEWFVFSDEFKALHRKPVANPK